MNAEIEIDMETNIGIGIDNYIELVKQSTDKIGNLYKHVDYLFILSFFIKMLFLVDVFVAKIHIILKLYVALPFTFLYLKQYCGSK